MSTKAEGQMLNLKKDKAEGKGRMASPPMTLLVKLGSLIIHYQEPASPQGHPMDQEAINSLERDPEVLAWLRQMGERGLLPLKRSA